MTYAQKRDIQYKLKVYIATFTSQAKACKSLDNVSESTIICMANPKEKCWDAISDDMWRNVAAQIGGMADYSKMVETQNFHTLTLYYDLAKQEGTTFALVGSAGWGKTYAAKFYSGANRANNVFYIECAEFLDRKNFLRKVLMQLGESYFGFGLSEMMEAIVRRMRKLDRPLIIMDEVDKLPDQVLKFFITFYNELNGKCGFIWQSTNAIEKRIQHGRDRNMVGYNELFSRIGANFINLTMPCRDEVTEICIINGIKDKEAIAQICNEIADLRGDLRRVDRSLLKNKIRTKSKAVA